MMLLALALATALPVPRATLLGWSADGRVVAVQGTADSVERHGKTPVGEARFLILANGAGEVQRVLRAERVQLVSDQPPFTLAAPLEQLWAKAPDGSRFDRGKLVRIGDGQEGVTGPVELARGDVRFRVRFEQGKKATRLIASLGGISTALDEDEGPGGDPQNDLETAWSPDGQSVALLWNALRGPVQRAHLAVASARAIASVDLLDAGAGAPRHEKVSQALEQAGFRVAHRGKAVAQRTATVVYFAAGFEAEAREAARLAGGSAQPLAFKSPYALTVALAREQ